MKLTGFKFLMAKRNMKTPELIQLMKEKAGFKVSRQTVSRWRANKTLPSGDSLYALISIFGEEEISKAFGLKEVKKRG